MGRRPTFDCDSAPKAWFTARLFGAAQEEKLPRYVIKGAIASRTHCHRNVQPGPSHDHEHVVAADFPAIRVGKVGGSVVVLAVHDLAKNERRTRPDHGRRPDEKAAHDAGDAESHSLCGDDEDQLKAPSLELVLVDLLRQENVEGVAEAGTGSSHDGDDGVLCFTGRCCWRDGRLPTKQSKLPMWHVLGPATSHGVGNQLNDGRSNPHTEVVVAQDAAQYVSETSRRCRFNTLKGPPKGDLDWNSHVHGTDNGTGDSLNYLGMVSTNK